MFKNLIPADLISRERHPREEAPCYAGPVDVAALEKQLAAQHERCLRIAANFENFKKRTALLERRAAAQKEEFVRDLLPVFDNLERALANTSPALNDPLREGLRMTHQQFLDLMREHGFEPREDAGQPFDPNYHEAVVTRAEPKHRAFTVIEVWQRGWLRGTDLFRPAKVVVNDPSRKAAGENHEEKKALSYV